MASCNSQEGGDSFKEIGLGFSNSSTMGRKIPGKKHRTVKDPYKQKEKHLDRIRDKINNPPANANEQEIPKSLLKIMELKNKAKQMVNKRPKKRNSGPVILSVAKFLDKEQIQKGMKKPDKYIPNLVQKPNESAKNFLKRINSMTENLIKEVEFEKKFGVEIQKNLETGEILQVKKLKKRSKSKKQKLSEKRKEKLNKKKENLKNIKDFSQLKDYVEFGELVHKPPALPKIKKKENEIQRPKFSNLILNNCVKSTQEKSQDLQSNLEKEKKEQERKFIVEAYRRLRKKKTE